jgi:hypothetical protein
MADPKDHHFSPVCYLNGWRNADGKIGEYSRPYKKVVAKPVSPAATGFKRSLYSLEGVPLEKRQDIEKNYMAPFVDERGAAALSVLIDRDNSKLTDDVRSN